MTRIGLISDTHHYLDPAVFKHFSNCDEIWHAGDFGTSSLSSALAQFKPLKGVFGNIDGPDIRSQFPEKLSWQCEGISIYMTHIGGYPPKYNSVVKNELLALKPNLFICGHSHILRIIYDEKIPCLYMNPGAAGNQGWHKLRTLVRFSIDGNEISNCEIIELGKRG
jgi:putative phosphoesterase